MTAKRAAVLLVALLAAGCVQQIPPPATPDPVPPLVEDLPPVEEGNGRVIVDVVDGPTDVMAFMRHSLVVEVDKGKTLTASSVSTETLCTSPCAVDLPLGRHTLAFPTRGGRGRLEVGQVDVGAVPTVYRRALGSYESAGAGLVLGILGVTFGGMSAITGMVLLPVGLANENDGMTLAGGITLGVGALLTTVGIIGIAVSPSTEQPGASIQFVLP
jgi:hypothetical protein